jgi:hypothetical protein
MARKLRVEYAGAMDHVMKRGDRRERILAEELKRGRWQGADLKTRPKGYPVKVALAARLRAETTMTAGWIAERLAMGTRGYLNHLVPPEEAGQGVTNIKN